MHSNSQTWTDSLSWFGADLEQKNNELQAPNKSSEASMPSNVADGVEAKLPDLPSEAEDFHEKLDESASVNQPEMVDQQIQEQTSTERG